MPGEILPSSFLRRENIACNMARFYIVSVERSLLDGFTLVREWGRIGTRGRRRNDLFEHYRDALSAYEWLLRAKLKRGYFERVDSCQLGA
jgi:predicted DNA-binding WGR domain protein